MDSLLTTFRLGDLELPNRVVMAPLTRSRADQRGVQTPLAPKYYGQRASAGLIIAEATTVSPQAVGYDGGPGLYTAAQTRAWRDVTDAVHARGGRVFIQLFHAGRMSHPVFHHGEQPVGPSAIAAGPRHQLYDTAHEFSGRGARARRAARDRRSVPGGGGEPGVRISPLSPTNGMSDEDPHLTFTTAARALDKLGIAYLHVIEPGVNGTLSEAAAVVSPDLGTGYFRPLFSGPIIAAGGHDARTGTARVAHGDADLVAYGKLYIGNLDLPERFAAGAPLNAADRATFYGGDAHGYTDYRPSRHSPSWRRRWRSPRNHRAAPVSASTETMGPRPASVPRGAQP